MFKKLLAVLLLLPCARTARPQQQINPATQIRWPGVTGTSDPAAPNWPCTPTYYGEVYTNTATGKLFNCGAGGWAATGAGTVTGFAAPPASWPSWLVPSVTDAATSPSLAVSAEPIPNGALANSTTTVNGIACSLGGSCVVTAGGGSYVELFPTGPQTVAGQDMTFSQINTSPTSSNVNELSVAGSAFGQGGYQNSGPWSSANGLHIDLATSMRAISQLVGGTFTQNAMGDGSDLYIYGNHFGGAYFSSDQGINPFVIQDAQIGHGVGTLATPTVGGRYGATGAPEAPGTSFVSIISDSGNFVTFPTSAPLEAITVNFPTAVTSAYTLYFDIYAPNTAVTGPGNPASTPFTLVTSLPVSVPLGTSGIKTFVSGTDFTYTPSPGQFIGTHWTSGTGPGFSYSDQSYCLAGAPSGTANYALCSGTPIIEAIQASPTQGASSIAMTGLACTGGQCLSNLAFSIADGSILYDQTQGGTNTATVALNGDGSNMGGMYYTLASGTVAPSTAWGNVVSCSPNTYTGGQGTTLETCTVAIGLSPASPGSLVVSTPGTGPDVCMAGQYQEEVQVLSATEDTGPPNYQQTITLNSAYSHQPGELLMQGGPCGQAFVVSTGANWPSPSSWPIAFAAQGATYDETLNTTYLYFEQCLGGSGCAGANSLLVSPLPDFSHQVPNSTNLVLTRTSNVVSMSPVVTNVSSGPLSYPVGSTVVVSCSDLPDLNGTFTVTGNSYDNTASAVTWDQTGSNETSTADCFVQAPNMGLTFYPMAFVMGSEGTGGAANSLGSNTVPFVVGDTIVGAPTAIYQSNNTITEAQYTPENGSRFSNGLVLQDYGTYPMHSAITVANGGGTGRTSAVALEADGWYSNLFYMNYRPYGNGTLLYVNGTEPLPGTGKPYNIFADGNAGGTAGGIQFNPNTHAYTLGGPVSAPSLNATTGCYEVAGSCGAAGQTLKSQGPGLPSSWGSGNNVILSIPASTQAASSCTAISSFALPGAVPTTLPSTPGSVVVPGYVGDTAGLVGWDSSGGMKLTLWASAANTVSGKVCNQTNAAISYSAISFVVGVM